MRIFLVVGARPNFMKIAPIYAAMRDHPAFEALIVHTGQHYDENMSRIFFEQLELPRPDLYLGVGSGSHAEQTAEIMRRFAAEAEEYRPHLVVVVGDVNSTVACAVTSCKLQFPEDEMSGVWEEYERYLGTHANVPGVQAFHRKTHRSHGAPIIAHVEAGERSFDRSMPEEVNRVVTDVLSDLLFTTCEESSHNLRNEGIDPRKIFCVGNVMIDALKGFLEKAETSDILERLNRERASQGKAVLEGKAFGLATLHRPGNVDEPRSLATIVAGLVRVSHRLPIVFPVHPRTRKLLGELDASLQQHLAESRVHLCDPLGYLDFVHLQSQARMVLTDSGGVQVEASYLGVPCLTLRRTTEWQVTLTRGTNRLVDPEEDAIVAAADAVLQQREPRPATIELWDGQAATRLVECLEQVFALR